MEAAILAALRIFAHLELLSIFVMLSMTVYAARYIVIPIDFYHWRVLVAGTLLLSLWIIFLILSVGPSSWVPRSTIIPLLTALELAGATAVLVGLILTFRRNFKVSLELDRDPKQGVL